jgi:hypothetical protein
MSDMLMLFRFPHYRSAPYVYDKAILLAISVIELALFIVKIVASSRQTDTVSCTRDLTHAVIGDLSSFSGMVGARKLDRGVLLLCFVLLVWGIAATTTNITCNVLELSKQNDICAYEETGELTSDACRHANIFLAADWRC